MSKISYVLSFDSTSYAMAAEKIMMEHFNITIIPTPREITQNCGLSLKINDNDINKIIEQIKLMDIPCVLYSLREETIPRRVDIILTLT